jgi:hypothetical protein
MAYHLNHIAEFDSRITQSVRLELYKKDFLPAIVTTLILTSSQLSYPKNQNGKFDDIIGAEYHFSLFLKQADTVDFNDLLVTFNDEWKVILYVDSVVNFIGFLVPGLGTVQYRDKPYTIQLTATDGLGLLKGAPLTDTDDTNFDGVHLQIDYIKAILLKTGLQLPIRVYSSVIEESMTDRNTDPNKDTLNQSGLHGRTFLKDAITYFDCYKTLQTIFGEYFTLYQWRGMWLIRNNDELQSSVGLKNWYTDYDSDGNITGAAQSGENPCEVGRDKQLEPINIANLSSRFAVKSAKHKWDYNVWPEIPKNIKFEYGDFILLLSAPPETRAFTIAGWDYLRRTGSYSVFPFGTTAATQAAYSKRTYNDFGVEIERELICVKPLEGQFNWLRSEGIPVNKGDKINFSCDKRFDNNVTVNASVAKIYIVPETGSDYYSWLYDFTEGAADNNWLKNLLSDTGLKVHYDAGDDLDENGLTQFKSIDAESPALPIDGTLFIVLEIPGEDDFGTNQYYKNVNFEYIPYIAGGYVRIKGDYWFTQQNVPLQDIIDKEVFVSDSLKKVLQGALYRENLTDLTTPTWHRLGIVESRHYKELANLARFNNEYRRFFEVSGTIKGTTYSPFDDSTTIEPLSFHRHFMFPTMAKLSNRYFILTPPLSIDHGTGRHNGVYVETLKSSLLPDGGYTEEEVVTQLVSLLYPQLSGTNQAAFTGTDEGTGGASWLFTITGNVKEGDLFRLRMNVTGVGTITVSEYQAVAGDTPDDVALELFNNASGSGIFATGVSLNQFFLNATAGSTVVEMLIIPGYNLTALVGNLSGNTNYFRVYCGPSDTVSVSTNDGGAGNSPVITEISNTLVGSQRLYIFRVEPDIEFGNEFTVNVVLNSGENYDAVYTATSLVANADGNQVGDIHEFKYIF